MKQNDENKNIYGGNSILQKRSKIDDAENENKAEKKLELQEKNSNAIVGVVVSNEDKGLVLDKGKELVFKEREANKNTGGIVGVDKGKKVLDGKKKWLKRI